jgi:NAD(P)-dependent dehydrogenase (short-subunit alcohol dehydrogenase family)
LRPVDLADSVSLESFVHDVAGDGFDILVNCAGINKISEFGPFEDTKAGDFDLIQRVNVSAPFRLMQAVLPGMKARHWGRIVNITSIFGVISKAQRAAYSTSKFALDGLTTSLAAEVAGFGVLANCVAPGFVETDMTRQALGEAGMREMAAQVPIGRLAQPEEIARLVAWLASEDNTYVSGQTYIIDGGFTRV